jgi:hypothetical protein
MPINSPKKDDYSDLLLAISSLTLQGGGSSGLRYARSVEFTLPANEETIILGSSTDCVREINLINESPAEIQLFWNDGIAITAIPGTLKGANSSYEDWNDGGLELRAKSNASANIKLLVRSNKPINYQIGVEEMTPVKIILYAPTDRDYLGNDLDPGNFGANLSRLLGSSDNVIGHKLFAVADSTPGKELNFTIQTTLQTPIVFQWIDPFEIALQGFKIASDILNPEIENLPSDFVGRITSESSWMSSISSTATPIKIKPDRCHYVGRFMAISPITGKLDTAVITNYTPNPTIFEGGIVTLGGF